MKSSPMLHLYKNDITAYKQLQDPVVTRRDISADGMATESRPPADFAKQKNKCTDVKSRFT